MQPTSPQQQAEWAPITQASAVEYGAVRARGPVPGHLPEKSDLARTVVYSYTLALFCLFAAPTIICLQLGFDPDVAFWIGRWGLLAFIVPFFVVIMLALHVVLLARGTRSRHIFLWAIGVPAVFFCFMGGMFMHQGSYLYGQLKSADCTGGGFLPEKKKLQEGYDEARTIYGACVTRLFHENGGKSLPYRPTLRRCDEFNQLHEPMRDDQGRVADGSSDRDDEPSGSAPNFRRGTSDSERRQRRTLTSAGTRAGGGVQQDEPDDEPDDVVDRQWDYLASVEANHVCGGWCKPGPMLWTSYDEVGSGGRCSSYVAQKFLTVSHHGTVILVVELLTIVIAFVYYLRSSKTLSGLGYA